MVGGDFGAQLVIYFLLLMSVALTFKIPLHCSQQKHTFRKGFFVAVVYSGVERCFVLFCFVLPLCAKKSERLFSLKEHLVLWNLFQWELPT